MKVLFEGIYSLFNTTNDFNTAVSGQMFPHKVDQEDATFPYAAYYLITDYNDYNFSDDYEDFMVQFSIYSDNNSPSEVLTIFEYLKTLFDDAEPTVTGYTVLEFKRTMMRLTNGLEGDTYQIDVDYEIKLERERT